MALPRDAFAVLPSGIRLHYLEWPGPGPTALLVHGTSFCADMWTPLAASLASQWRVLAVDLRGHGRSAKPEGVYSWEVFAEDLLGLADVLGLRDMFIIGHSVGAIATMRAAAERPGLGRGLVLVEPMAIRPSAPATVAGDASLVERTRKRRAQWPSRGEVHAHLGKRPPYDRWRPDIFEHYVEAGTEVLPDGRAVLRCAPETEAEIYEARTSLDIWDSIGKLTVPALLVVGEKSHMGLSLESEPVQRFLRLAAKGRAVCMPGATHWFPQEQPEDFERLVRGFAGQAR